jgi:hypothetical protein
MKKITVITFAILFVTSANAQIDLNKIINLDQILGKVLSVKIRVSKAINSSCKYCSHWVNCKIFNQSSIVQSG